MHARITTWRKDTPSRAKNGGRREETLTDNDELGEERRRPKACPTGFPLFFALELDEVSLSVINKEGRGE